MTLTYQIETDREADGRWIAEVPSLPSVMAYGKTEDEAAAAAEALALRVIADQIEEQKEPAKVSVTSSNQPFHFLLGETLRQWTAVLWWPHDPVRRLRHNLQRLQELVKQKGYAVKRKSGSHIVLEHPSRGRYVWAFHDSEEIGPKMLARIAKHIGLEFG